MLKEMKLALIVGGLVAATLLLGASGTFWSRDEALNFIKTGTDSLVYLATPQPEWITVVSGMTIPLAKHMTFPMPLVPMGNHSQVAFNISCTTWPDTLWYQVVAASTPMDSLTVFNFGTTEAPNFLRYIVSANLSGASSAVTTKCEYLDNAFSEKWSPTGLDFNPSVGSYTFPVKDIAGLYTGAKYIGIRVGADAGKPIVGLRVVMEMK